MKAWAIGWATAVLLATLAVVSPAPSVEAATGSPVAVDIEFTPNENGYYVLDSYGRVTTFGSAPYYGGSPPLQGTERAVSISPTPSGLGYWIFTDLGRVFTYGDAQFFGDLSALNLDGPVLDSVPTPSGNGYYMLGDDGGIFANGDAQFYGSIPGVLPPGTELDGKIVGLAPTPTGLGYWLVAEDGGMFTFGDAAFLGSIPGVLPPGTVLDMPVVGMVPQGNGYLMVAADGGIFSFGQSVFHGSIPGLADPNARVQSAAQEIVAVAVLSDNSGYVMLSANGQIWVFGAVQSLGSPDVTTPANPGNTVNCSDFATQVDAQRWHDLYFPFYGDVGGLDADGDGEVCESLVASPAQQVASADGNLTITVPEGVAPPGVTVTVETAPVDAFGPNQIGAAYRLGPDGTNFAGPVTIALRVPSIPANVTSNALQLGLRSSGGEITGLSTLLSAHPDGGFLLTSATSHFTDVGVLPDSLPLDPGLMQLTCQAGGGPSFDCTSGPIIADIGQEITIKRTGGLTGPGALNLASSNTGDIVVDGSSTFECQQVGFAYVTAAATSVPDALAVTPFSHVPVACQQSDVTEMLYKTSPAPGTSEAAPDIDSVYVGRLSGGGFRVGVQPGAPTGQNEFGALFLENHESGNAEALTTRNQKHVGSDIGDVGGQVFFDQDGMSLPAGYDVANTPGRAEYGLPPSAGGRSLVRTENTGQNGFSSDFFFPGSSNVIEDLLSATEGSPAPTCQDSATTLCLQQSRFRVTVDWVDFESTGSGSVVNPGNGGGVFYFFDTNNWEMLVRVIDGCGSFNDRFWVFAAATTNVEYELRVTDTVTGQERLYTNPLGQDAPAILDTSAFATCD